MASFIHFIFSLLLILSLFGNYLNVVDARNAKHCQLTTHYYAHSCPQLLHIVNTIVQSAVQKEARMAASLLRLHFHDCFVQGCDASILLDGTSSITSEKTAAPNANSVRGYEVIDEIKKAVEYHCPNIVSCADIVTLAARDAVVSVGGPSWMVKMGRKDSITANPSAALRNLISPAANLSAMVSGFKAKGFSTRELVALYGAHTIGKARCVNFRAHIYNDTNIDPKFARQQQEICPRSVGQGDNNLAPFDVDSPIKFDNTYYGGLIAKRTILHSDQEFFNGNAVDLLVKKYYSNQNIFFSDFADAMVKMGDMQPPAGSQGEIRTNCRMINH